MIYVHNLAVLLLLAVGTVTSIDSHHANRHSDSSSSSASSLRAVLAPATRDKFPRFRRAAAEVNTAEYVRFSIFPRNTQCSAWGPGGTKPYTERPETVPEAEWTKLWADEAPTVGDEGKEKTTGLAWSRVCGLVEKGGRSRAEVGLDEWKAEFELAWAKMGNDAENQKVFKVLVWPEWRFRAALGDEPLSVGEYNHIIKGMGAFLQTGGYRTNTLVLRHHLLRHRTQASEDFPCHNCPPQQRP
jgi:hypothetical protein